MDDFALQNPAGFPAGDFVRAKSHAVGDASALLHHQVEIIALELDDLTLNMLEDTHGKWNFENPPAPAEPPAKPTGDNDSASFSLGVISKVTVARRRLLRGKSAAIGSTGAGACGRAWKLDRLERREFERFYNRITPGTRIRSGRICRAGGFAQSDSLREIHWGRRWPREH